MEQIIRDSKTNLENGIYTICDGCPCLNIDYEYGESCNLGYNGNFYQIKDGDVRAVSSDCKLVTIITTDNKEFPKNEIGITG